MKEHGFAYFNCDSNISNEYLGIALLREMKDHVLSAKFLQLYNK